MKINVSQQLLNAYGLPDTMDGTVITPRYLFCKELEYMPLGNENKYSTGKLMKTLNTEDEPDLDTNEIMLLKRAAHRTLPHQVNQLWDILEPEVLEFSEGIEQ